jgi:DNA polymerase-1
MPAKKSFYIIDGHAHIYRAFFAPFRDLTSSTGEPTKATFVFTQMLLNLIQLRKPDYLAMVIDSGDESVFRKTIFPEYKANRQSPPDDFKPQEKRILQIVKDSGVPIFVKPGFEADDLIATMAVQLCQEDYEVFLVSKDKDLRQILTDCTHMYDPVKDEVIDVAKLREKVGYGPELAIDVQTLMGDAIDNVPGIPGVGEKTAVKLLTQYGSVAGILENVEKLTPKMRDNFKAYADKLPMSRELVTLKTDVAFDWSPEQCRFTGLDAAGLKKHLIELDFRALLGRLSDLERAARPRPALAGGLFDTIETQTVGGAPNHDYKNSTAAAYTLINSPEAFDDFLAELKRQKSFAFDTETDNLKACEANVVGLSFSWAEGTGYYVPLKAPKGEAVIDPQRTMTALKPILEDPQFGKVGHNIKYDILAMKSLGVDLRGVVMDTMVAAFLLDASRIQYGIDRLAIDLLHFKKIATTDVIGTGKNQITMDRVALSEITRYAGEDADITWRLHTLVSGKLDQTPALRKLHDEVELPLIDVLVEMERAGVAVDEPTLIEQSKALGERIDKLREQIHAAANGEFNIDSPKQLGEVLFTRLGLKSVKKTKTGHSTDIEVLERLSGVHPVPKLVLEYRSLVKLKGTYLDALAEHKSERDGRVHTSFNQTGAATGRLSSSDPNLQNIPIRTDEGRRIRLAFVPGKPGDVLLTADYAQIELRVLAHFTQEPALLESFKNNEDVHRKVAAEVFGVPLDQVSREQRAQAKIVNFGIIYGVTAHGLARRIDGMNNAAAAELIAAYNKRFPSIARFMDQCVQKARADGYVETLTGRRRPVFDINSGVLTQRSAAERIAINSVVQGTAADLIKIAMVNIHRRIKAERRPLQMLLQVHDELVFECPEADAEPQAAFVKDEMTRAMTLSVPLDVEVGWGKNWQEVK